MTSLEEIDSVGVMQDEYAALCAACDGVLLAADAGPDRVAVSWLHVQREHPQALERYRALFSEPEDTGLGELGYLGYWGGRLMRSLFSSWAASEGTCDVLIISHLVSRDHRAAERDFYYGSLTEDLVERGLRPVLALLDHVGTSSRGQQLPAAHRVPRLLVPTIGPLGHECQSLADMLRERRILLRVMPHDALERRVRRAAARQALGPASADAKAIAAAVGMLVGSLQPRALVTTFEGHAWERLAFQAARHARPGIRCIGYQHSLVSSGQHSLLRPLGRPFDPDVVLTSGPTSRARLLRHPGLSHIDVRVLGSDRASAAHAPPRTRSSGDTCLVVPEGFPDECRILLEFSIAAARTLPSLRFVWRLHPLMTMSALERRYPSLRQRPSNVEISARPLSDDVGEATHVLYRGSTAVIPAVAAGAHPIYLRRVGEMPIDPLHEASIGRDVVVDLSDFSRAVSRVRTADEVAAVRTVCAGLFAPLDPEVLVQALGSPGTGAEVPRADSGTP